MSKAFTRESDDLPDDPVPPRLPSSLLPPGAKNYLTPGGARRLHEELEHLIQVERPLHARSADDNEAKRQLVSLDHRIRQLQQSLQAAVVVPPPLTPKDRIRFGATVKVRDRSGAESRYRIVGVDETDLDQGWVSWLSPIAKALLNAQLGQRVRIQLPTGLEELVVLDIDYQ